MKHLIGACLIVYVLVRTDDNIYRETYDGTDMTIASVQQIIASKDRQDGNRRSIVDKATFFSPSNDAVPTKEELDRESERVAREGIRKDATKIILDKTKTDTERLDALILFMGIKEN